MIACHISDRSMIVEVVNKYIYFFFGIVDGRREDKERNRYCNGRRHLFINTVVCLLF